MELRFFKRSRTNWTPASYTADETALILNVAAGDLIGPGFARVRTVFNGGGTDAIIIVGDGGTTNLFCANGNIDETATGTYQLLGAGTYVARGEYLYTAADTIDVGFTANTSGTRTTGAVDFWFFVAKVDPH